MSIDTFTAMSCMFCRVVFVIMQLRVNINACGLLCYGLYSITLLKVLIMQMELSGGLLKS